MLITSFCDVIDQCDSYLEFPHGESSPLSANITISVTTTYYAIIKKALANMIMTFRSTLLDISLHTYSLFSKCFYPFSILSMTKIFKR